eukprot:s1015_g8.t1
MIPERMGMNVGGRLNLREIPPPQVCVHTSAPAHVRGSVLCSSNRKCASEPQRDAARLSNSSQRSDWHPLAEMSKAVYCAALVLVGLLVVYPETLGFVASPGSLAVSTAPVSSVNRPAAPARTVEAAPVGVATGVYGLALLATAAAGVLARAKRSKVMVHNYGGFKPVVGDRYQYTNDVGYLADGTPISTAGNNSIRRTSYDPPPVAAPAPPVAVVAPVAPVAPAPVAPPTPVAAPIPATGGEASASRRMLTQTWSS